MAVTNNFSGGKPNPTLGLTGAQSYKFIHAPRVFIKPTPDSVTAAVPPAVKSNGTIATITATGWTDLGIVNGNLKISYEKKVKEVRTGIDNYLRDAYTNQKGGTLEFEMAQLDDLALASISGLVGSMITSNSIYTFHVGQEDLVPMALLFIAVNKLNGKEIQWYSPRVLMNFAFSDSSDTLVMKATGIMPAYTCLGQTNEEFLSTTFYA